MIIDNFKDLSVKYPLKIVKGDDTIIDSTPDFIGKNPSEIIIKAAEQYAHLGTFLAIIRGDVRTLEHQIKLDEIATKKEIKRQFIVNDKKIAEKLKVNEYLVKKKEELIDLKKARDILQVRVYYLEWVRDLFNKRAEYISRTDEEERSIKTSVIKKQQRIAQGEEVYDK